MEEKPKNTYLDPCNLNSWGYKSIQYTKHAQEQAIIRDITILRYLPDKEHLRLVNVDYEHFVGISAITLKVLESVNIRCRDGKLCGDFFIVLSPSGRVITTYKKDNDDKFNTHYENRGKINESIDRGLNFDPRDLNVGSRNKNRERRVLNKTRRNAQN